MGSGPFSVAITPLVPFAFSFTKLGIAKDSFNLQETFTARSNINPVTENVTLQIGTFSVTIPVGSFKPNPNGSFAFQGVINGVSMQVLIVPVGNNTFTLNAVGKGVNFPVTVGLTIGNNTGTTTVTPQFK